MDSPIIFNVIVDSVIRTWKGNQNYQKSDACFYADDGLIQHHKADKLQTHINQMINLFKSVRLKPNATTTKFMIFWGAPAPTALSETQYKKRKSQKKNYLH